MEHTAKYEFTGEIHTVHKNGIAHTVNRIRALKDFAPPNKIGEVHKGDLGGWIESEENLSQDGLCWIDEEAVAIEKATIKDNAYVCENSWIHGNAVISENGTVDESAIVGGNVIVCGDAYVGGEAQIYGYLTIKGTVIITGYIIINNSSNITVIKCDDDLPFDENALLESQRTVLDGNIRIDSSITQDD